MITLKGKAIGLDLARRGVEITDHKLWMLSKISRLAHRYARIQVAWCNVEMTERQTSRMEAKEARLEVLMTQHAAQIGLTIKFEGDPRSYVVRLQDNGRDYVGVA